MTVGEFENLEATMSNRRKEVERSEQIAVLVMIVSFIGLFAGLVLAQSLYPFAIGLFGFVIALIALILIDKPVQKEFNEANEMLNERKYQEWEKNIQKGLATVNCELNQLWTDGTAIYISETYESYRKNVLSFAEQLVLPRDIYWTSLLVDNIQYYTYDASLKAMVLQYTDEHGNTVQNMLEGREIYDCFLKLVPEKDYATQQLKLQTQNG